MATSGMVHIRRTSSAGLTFVDIVVMAGRGRRLDQIGDASRPALDLESPLVVGVEKHRKVQCDEADGHEDAADDAGVREAVMPLMQDVPRSGHADVGEEQHRPRHDRPQVRHHEGGTGHALQMLGVGARPDDTDDQVRGAKNQRTDDQLTDRHP